MGVVRWAIAEKQVVEVRAGSCNGASSGLVRQRRRHNGACRSEETHAARHLRPSLESGMVVV